MEWISVNDRLPERTGEYICVCTHWCTIVTGLDFTNGDWVSENPDQDWNPYVSHWMPLPEPPKDSSNDNN